MTEVDALEFENRMVLAAVQALYGAIPSNLLAVTMESDATAQTLDLYFAASHVTDRLLKLIGEISDDLEALTAGEVLIRTHLWEGLRWNVDWPNAVKRPVFATYSPLRRPDDP